MKMQEIESFIVRKLPIDSGKKNVLNRRINKLKRDPRGFLKNSYRKRSEMIKSNLPIKYNSVRNYTIVTAVFNSEKYLDHYFHSIVNQSLDFKRNIRIICVDDGSTDQSADIIKHWIKKYPKNITYLFKENGGQASARNLGLKKVNSDWVTFIDSDDFLAKDYFYQVDKAIVNNKNIKAVSCNQIYYIEESDQYVEGHPLKYRFKTENNLVPCNDLKKNVQFSTALIFLKTSSIPSFLTFDESLRPTFEDGKFVNTYLLSQSKNSLIYFHPKAKYFNRKREDKSSTMDNVWIDKRQFNVVLQEGYLNLLSTTYNNLGYVPEFIQRTILWEILRLVKRLMNREERVNFLTVEEKDNLIELIRQTFKYIDESTILNYELGRPGFSRQLGMLGCFKGVDVSKQVVYIDEIDHTKKQFLTRFFSSFDPLYQVYTDSGEIFPLFVKKTDRMFLSERFLTEYRVWLPIPEKGVINVSIDQKNASITYLDHKYKNGLDVSKLVVKNVKKQDIWLLMDRDDRAGDNAEFLYKYLKKNDCTQSIYFILDRKSIDWDRLHEEGFNLVSHGSSEHKNLLEECSLVISSQTNRLIEPFENINKNYKIVFLQHGVIKDDLSNWLNTVDMNLMLTSSHEEYNSIVGDHSPYKYGEKEIKLTGLPRFDSLYNNRNRQVNKVLIMFTWRRGIAGNFINRLKSEREFNTDFVNTDYYMRINKLLKNNKMKGLAFKYNLSFVLCPHPNMNNYLQCFDIPEYIEIAQEEDLIHNLINDSSILITDYSSIAFDFAYQNKPVLYYQFDKDDFYNGNHTYTEGYFSYEENGFGP